MIVYYITIIAVFILAIIAQKYDYQQLQFNTVGNVSHTRKTWTYIIIIMMILIFVAGFRYDVGGDFFGYYNYTKYSSTFIDSIKNFDEPGFHFLMWLVALIKGSGATAIFVSAALTLTISLLTLYKNTDQIFLGTILFIFIGCWHGSFNGVRQYLASAIIFSGIKFIREKNFFKYLIIVFIATLFHKSAIIMILVYFAAHLRINAKNEMLLIAISVVALYSFNYVTKITNFILNEEIDFTNSYMANSVNILRILVAVIPTIYFLLIYWKREKNEIQIFSLNLLIINAIARVVTSNSAFLGRIGIYTAPFIVVAIPELIVGMENLKNKKITVIAVIVLYGFYCWWEIYNSSSLNNFQFVFSHI